MITATFATLYIAGIYFSYEIQQALYSRFVDWTLSK